MRERSKETVAVKWPGHGMRILNGDPSTGNFISDPGMRVLAERLRFGQ